MIIQYVKKRPASIVRPTMKYTIMEKMLTWIRMIGISAVICAIQNAAGWK